MALPKNKQSGFAKSSLGSPSVNADDALHLEIDRSQLEPWTKPGLAGHQWVQRGPYLVCRSCPIEHAVYVGMNTRLVGYNEDGEPILKRVDKRGRMM